MFGKCNCHITEIGNIFQQTFGILNNLTDVNFKYDYNIKPNLNPIKIDDNSSIGEQIKHYRQEKGIFQKDIAKLINVDRYTMHKIENSEYKQIYNPEYLDEIINFLEIEDKIIWNDKYLEFIFKNQYYKIKEFRITNNLNLEQFCELMGNIATSTVRNWENGKCKISRKMFDKFDELVRKTENNELLNEPAIEYINFIKNNPTEKFLKYIKKEQITISEFAKRMNRNISTIKNMLNGKTTITRKQYLKFKELLTNQELGIISSDPYINFLNNNPTEKIRTFLKNNNLSQNKLALKLGVSRVSVERWCSCNKPDKISRKNFEKLLLCIKKEGYSPLC